jgi:Matrixin/Abnormal spindle-like microcephaly-assoc'd, ASPM-SPD-2-Hydin/Repeat of unknown function (DUF5648)
MFFKSASHARRAFVSSLRGALCVACALCIAVVGSAGVASAQPDLPKSVPESDFRVILFGNPLDAQKYLTFGWNGWAGKTLRWRYNDANRPAAISASAADTVGRIQAAMAKWSSVCAIQFVYEGTTTSPASLATNSRDGANVIAWSALSGNTTGITYAGASGFTGTTLTLDEADMVVNYQFNPNLDSTFVHEVGHMIGLKHSNQEGAVMSGPNTPPDPSTTYSGVVIPQPDDISGCQSLYGAPAGTGTAPVAQVSASSLSFGNVTVGANAQQSVTLANNGNAPLAIGNVAVSGADFSLASGTCNAGMSVPAGGSCTAIVRFAPIGSATRSGSLNFTHNAAPGTSTVIALVGTGVTATTLQAIASVNVASLQLPATTAGSVSPGTAITLSNTGNIPMALGAVSTSSREFQVVASTCGFGTGFLSPGARCTTLFALAPVSASTLNGTILFTHGAGAGLTSVPVSGVGLTAPATPPATREMVEYRYAPLDYYFITSREAEKTALDNTAGFARTGNTFRVYAQQVGDMRAIMRFYFDRVAQSGSRGSHFYTLLNNDLLTLADQNPAQSTAPGFAQNEGVDSYAYLPLAPGVGGSCASGLAPVYRLFRGSARFPDNPNHRYTTSLATYNSFVALGWTGEGVNFCVLGS